MDNWKLKYKIGLSVAGIKNIKCTYLVPFTINCVPIAVNFHHTLKDVCLDMHWEEAQTDDPKDMSVSLERF